MTGVDGIARRRAPGGAPWCSGPCLSRPRHGLIDTNGDLVSMVGAAIVAKAFEIIGDIDDDVISDGDDDSGRCDCRACTPTAGNGAIIACGHTSALARIWDLV